MEREFFGKLRRELLNVLEEEKSWTDQEILSQIDEIILLNTRRSKLTIYEKEKIRKELFYSVRKLDILQELLEDDQITEIMVNGYNKIFYEKNGKKHKWEKQFFSEERLLDVIQQIVGKCNRVINENSPIVDARLEDGSRINAVIYPVALNGPILTIRRFPEQPITMEDLIANKSITEEVVQFLKSVVEAGYSILIGGGTSSGKTTFLNVLSNFIPKKERIITIEDCAELQIQGIDNLVRLEAKPANMEGNREITIRDMIRTALRMAPDRIIVGEVRGSEVVDLLQAWNTGHDGSMGTAHANSTKDMVSRIETMFLMGLEIPIEAIRMQIAAGIDLFIHLGRLMDGSRRILEISEVIGYMENEVKMQTLYKWDYVDKNLVRCNELLHKEKLERCLNGM